MKIGKISLEGLINTRDLAGITGKDLPKIKPHRLLRSAELAGLTARDTKILTERYKLCRVIDLRTPAEQKASPDPEIRGVEQIINPLLTNSAMGITHEEEGFATLFEEMRNPSFYTRDYMTGLYRNLICREEAIEGLRHFFALLLHDPKPGATLWHCGSGKDRVGVTTALLLTALGFDRQAILEDYMATNSFTFASVLRQVQQMTPDEDTHLRENLFVMFTTDTAFIRAALEEMQNSCGSMEGFLKKKLGIGEAECEQLRQEYLIL